MQRGVFERNRYRIERALRVAFGLTATRQDEVRCRICSKFLETGYAQCPRILSFAGRQILVGEAREERRTGILRQLRFKLGEGHHTVSAIGACRVDSCRRAAGVPREALSFRASHACLIDNQATKPKPVAKRSWNGTAASSR